MRDGRGNEIKAGDSLMICLTSPYLFAKVVEVHPGGTTMLARSRNMPPGVTPDAITLALEFKHVLQDAVPGERHTSVFLTVDPEKDRIVRIGD